MAERIIIVGAGVGGLAAAIELAGAGHDVTILERAAAPGGKMRRVTAGAAALDAGPTVLTMRWVFDELFARAGASLDASLTLHPAAILARHAWDDGASTLDLFADPARSADAIGTLAGAAEARGFLAFCDQARQIYATLDEPFIRGPRPTPLSLVRTAGVADMLRIHPFDTLWKALGRHFADPRLRQLFGRYATYCGSSPFAAPATLMLVAHVEQEGVWFVDGGMHELALALAALATRLGAHIRYGSHVAAITAGAQVSGITLVSGEHLPADAVILNADCATLAAGLFGAASASASPPVDRKTRSLSAVTWAMHATTRGFPLHRHNVFFSRDYPAEFTDLFAKRRLPSAPTIYICAQDRGDTPLPHTGPERLLCLVNAPATGDTAPLSPGDLDTCMAATFRLLDRCGLRVDQTTAATVRTTPTDFNALFPATGGALYGQAVHGAMATFRRPGSRTKLPGLYLAGGSTHPGAGVPMAALSGCRAADSVRADLASAPSSTGRSRPVAMSGGMSTR